MMLEGILSTLKYSEMNSIHLLYQSNARLDQSYERLRNKIVLFAAVSVKKKNQCFDSEGSAESELVPRSETDIRNQYI